MQFYSSDEALIEQWIESMSDYVVYLNVASVYDRGEFMGEGSFARVHACTLISDPGRKKYAMKQIRICKAQTKKKITTVLMEIDSLRKIKSDGILRLYKVFLSTKYVYLILDYLGGGELTERIKSLKKYDEGDAIKVMTNLLTALDHIHTQGVVHRDLKPENLILVSKEDDSDVRIADFGLATIMDGP